MNYLLLLEYDSDDDDLVEPTVLNNVFKIEADEPFGHPVYVRRNGNLVRATPGSPEAGFKRNPAQGNQLVKI